MRITGRSSNTNFLLGGTAQLSCEFKGTPSPQVQWYFKGRPVSDQHVITTNPSGGIVRGTTTLMISNFQFKDIGLYQCALSNYLQSVHQEFNLCGEGQYMRMYICYLKQQFNRLITNKVTELVVCISTT